MVDVDNDNDDEAAVDGCGSAGWGGLLHGLKRWYGVRAGATETERQRARERWWRHVEPCSAFP